MSRTACLRGAPRHPGARCRVGVLRAAPARHRGRGDQGGRLQDLPRTAGARRGTVGGRGAARLQRSGGRREQDEPPRGAGVPGPDRAALPVGTPRTGKPRPSRRQLSPEDADRLAVRA
ncbi:MAG: hypothetical protein MZU84_03885 [Sphingobacterium sp.]|nr:hypothetical protein [Sphingobacterium sp.]